MYSEDRKEQLVILTFYSIQAMGDLILDYIYKLNNMTYYVFTLIEPIVYTIAYKLFIVINA